MHVELAKTRNGTFESHEATEKLTEGYLYALNKPGKARPLALLSIAREALSSAASRRVSGKADKLELGDSTFERQSEALMTEAATVNSSPHEEDFNDVGCNADLCAFTFKSKGAFQGCSSSHERSQQVIDPYCDRLLFSAA